MFSNILDTKGSWTVIVPELRNCARCGGTHRNIHFKELTHYFVENDGTVWTHYAPCPSNSEPILLRTDVKEEEDEPGVR